MFFNYIGNVFDSTIIIISFPHIVGFEHPKYGYMYWQPAELKDTLVAGSVTLNLTELSPVTVVVAGMYALIVLLPNTGTSEWLLWAWLAMQVVTEGQYLALLPGGGLIG